MNKRQDNSNSEALATTDEQGANENAAETPTDEALAATHGDAGAPISALLESQEPEKKESESGEQHDESHDAPPVQSIAERPDASLSSANVLEAAQLVASDVVKDTPTAHLTLPSLPTRADVDARGNVNPDTEHYRRAMAEREARLHPNPPPEMEVRDGMTVQDLRDAAAGEGVHGGARVEDTRRIKVTTMQSDDARAGGTRVTETVLELAANKSDVATRDELQQQNEQSTSDTTDETA